MAKKCDECKSAYLNEIPEDVYDIITNEQGESLKTGNRLSVPRVIYKLIRKLKNDKNELD